MDFSQVQRIISEVLSVSADFITKDTAFVNDLGADSLEIYQIIIALEEEFEIEISTKDMEEIVTVDDVFQKIEAALV